MFSTLMIADRGEVVMRIARTCERMGIQTWVAHTAADADAAYLSACDEAIAIAGADAVDVGALIAAAKERGAQAIHPGSGMLARDPSFARAVITAGMAFVGPAPEILERFS